MVIDYIEILSTKSRVCVFVTPSVSRMKKKGKTVNCNWQSKVGWEVTFGQNLPILSSCRCSWHPSVGSTIRPSLRTLGKSGRKGWTDCSSSSGNDKRDLLSLFLMAAIVGAMARVCGSTVLPSLSSH